MRNSIFQIDDALYETTQDGVYPDDPPEIFQSHGMEVVDLEYLTSSECFGTTCIE